MKLEDIGFYTLTDERAANVTDSTQLHRCEMLVTSRCNFNCTYCRKRTEPDISPGQAIEILQIWIDEGLKNIRFSGGEPTIYPHLTQLVKYCKAGGVNRIAVSTNGSAPLYYYQELLDAGVNDFSISLDACCSETGDKIAGKSGSYDDVLQAIRYLAKRTYVTLGVVLFEDNMAELADIVALGDLLEVADIRLISAAQWNKPMYAKVPQHVRDKMPLLNYRLTNLEQNKPVRGLSTESDCNHCPLVLDDIIVEGSKHYPCPIYLRERGDAIGVMGSDVREQRKKWYGKHNTLSDPICKNNCLDICAAHNNRVAATNKKVGLNMFLGDER